MKRNTIKHLVPQSGTAAVLTLLLVSCNGKEDFSPNTNNPPVQVLAGQEFTVKLIVEEPGIAKDSTYIYEGVVSSGCPDGIVPFCSVTGVHSGERAKTFKVNPDPVELVLTPWNSIRFETSAPVNASSSSSIADIVRDGDFQHYCLKAVVDRDNPRELRAFDTVGTTERSDKPRAIAEGLTEIRFWNGPEDTGNSIAIRLRTANHIAVEGFEIAIDGQRLLLREYAGGTSYLELKDDAVLCRLPNIARPSEEYWERGRTDYKTEEIYDINDFTTIEFIGTIPRNATPDNRLTQIMDALSFRNYGIGPKEDYNDAYIWSSGNYPEFRWMFYRKEAQNYLKQRWAYKLYPADVRYRKSMIWNYLPEATPDRHDEYDFYFNYSVTPNPENAGDSKYYWGKLFVELAK